MAQAVEGVPSPMVDGEKGLVGRMNERRVIHAVGIILQAVVKENGCVVLALRYPTFLGGGVVIPYYRGH